MGVDETRQNNAVPGVEHLARRRQLEKFFGRPDRSDASVGHGHGSVANRFGTRLHREDGAADDQHVPVGLAAHSNLHGSTAVRLRKMTVVGFGHSNPVTPSGIG